MSSSGTSLILPALQLFTPSLLHQTNEEQISQYIFHYSEQYFYVSFVCQRQNSTEATPSPRLTQTLVIVNLAPLFFFPKFPPGSNHVLRLVFLQSKNVELSLSLLNLVPIVDPGNLNPCMFWYNSCVLKLTQVQLEEILSQEVLHVPRAVGQDHGNHQLAECLKLQGPSLAGFQLKQPWCLLLPLFCHPSIFSRRSAGFSYLGKSEHIFKVCLCAVEWSATGYSQPGFSCRQAFLFPSICSLCSRIAVSHISFFLWRIAGFIFL